MAGMGVEGDNMPFLLGPTALPLPQQSHMQSHLLPYMMEVCEKEGWGQQKLQLASKLCFSNQYMGRKLYGSLISRYYTMEEEVCQRASMMDTSMKMLVKMYSAYPISNEEEQLLECWQASGFPEI